MTRRAPDRVFLHDVPPDVRQRVAQTLEILPQMARVHPDRALLICQLTEDFWPVRPPRDRGRRQARVLALAAKKIA